MKGQYLVVGIVVVLVTGSAARMLAQVVPSPQKPPAILAAVLSADLSTLTLTGLHLGTGTPAVSLAATSLTVTGATPTTVTALLPAGLQTGTYLLALTRAGDRAMAIFYLSVGAVATGTPIPGTKQQPSGNTASDGGRQPANRQVDSGGSESPTPPTSTSASEADALGNTRYGVGALAGDPGGQNTAIGYQAGNAVTGPKEGDENESGEGNTLVGNASGRLLRTGSFNTFVGQASGQRTTVGTFNTFAGYGAGANNTTGNNNTHVGFYAGLKNSTGSWNIYLGHPGAASESKTIRIGITGFHTATYLAGAVYAPSFVGDGSKLTGVVAVYQ